MYNHIASIFFLFLHFFFEPKFSSKACGFLKPIHELIKKTNSVENVEKIINNENINTKMKNDTMKILNSSTFPNLKL